LQRRKGLSRNMSNKGRLRKNKGRNMKKMFLRRCWPRKGLRLRKRR
jgi:hypothetical protein